MARTGRALTAVIVAALAAPLLPVGAAPAAAAPACGPTISAPLADRPWPLRRLRPDLVWPVTQGAGVTVAVIDSGVSPDHPALSGQVLNGIDLVEPGQLGHCDRVGHGTMIAGIIAGRPTPTSGFTGIAPAAKIMPIRVLASSERTFDDEHPRRIANAIRLATDRGAKVINLSLTTVPIPELSEAVRYAQGKNVVLVAAAGNEGGSQSDQPEPAYPAAYDGVIAVAGVDEQGNHVPTSSTGDYVDIAAPGFEIAGPAPQGGGYAYQPKGGTSFAAGYVSGIVALVRAGQPDLPAEEVVDRVLRTADRPPNGWDRDLGFGVANPYWAVTSIAAPAGAPTGPSGAPAALAPPRPDPQEWIRPVALYTALGAIVGSVLVLTAATVVRRGRSRRWRPGRSVQ